MQRFRIGLIGVSGQGEDHLQGVLNSINCELVAVCDKNEDVLGEFSRKHPNVPSFLDYKALFGEVEMEGVIVCIPHHVYPEIIQVACDKHIHILKEKPFARSLREGHGFYQMAKQANITLMICTQRRFNPIFASVPSLIVRIGELFLVGGRYVFSSSPPDFGWRAKRELAGGGAILDMGYHMLDLILWYTRLPDEVFAKSANLARPWVDYDTEDTAVVNFSYKEGAIGSLVLSRATIPKEEYLSIHGTRGIVVVQRGHLQEFTIDGEKVADLQREYGWGTAFSEQIDHFAECIINGKSPISNSEYQLQHLAFVDACYESQKLNQPVNPWDLLNKFREVV